MLAHQQALAVALQRHIEGVLAGHGRVAVAVVAAALLGVVPVDGADAALPRLVADPGTDDHRRALGQHAGVVFIHIALDAEAARLHDGHERQGVAGVVRAAVRVQGLHLAVHRGLDGAVGGVGLQLLNVLFLGGDVGLRLQHLHVLLPQIQGVLPLGGVVIGAVHQLLYTLQLRLLVLQRGVQLLQLQLGHLQVGADLAEVIGQQHVALFHAVAHLHLDGVDGHGVVFLDGRLAQRADDAREPVRQTYGPQPADHRHRLHGGLALRCAAAGHTAQQHHQRQYKSRFFHVVFSFFLPARPRDDLPIYLDGRNCHSVPPLPPTISYHAPGPQNVNKS